MSEQSLKVQEGEYERLQQQVLGREERVDTFITV